MFSSQFDASEGSLRRTAGDRRTDEAAAAPDMHRWAAGSAPERPRRYLDLPPEDPPEEPPLEPPLEPLPDDPVEEDWEPCAE